jgi:uncharacterized protein (DUF1501 family)
MYSRRTFLKQSIATTGLIAWGINAPRFLSQTALATPPAGKAGAKDTILVVVQLTGGNDGLNTVVPFADDGYGKLRKDLRLPTDQLKKLNDQVGLHPSLDGLAGLWEDKALCVVQGVGYPNPDESHFRSMDIWQGASQEKSITEGWLGKALVRLKDTPAFHCAMDNESSPLAFSGAPVKVPSLARLEDFQLKTLASSGSDRTAQKRVIEEAAKIGSGKNGGLLDFVQQTAVNTYASSKRLQELAKNYQPKVTYPNTGLANRLKLAAQLIEADMGARVFYVTIDGFDTHANQLQTHANLLKEVSDAMTAFFKDMAARGQRDRVLMMTFSEFGRRAKENGSKGTDHGSAAPMFLVGGKVKPGVVGAHPSLTDLYMNKLKHHTDFRQVYAAILDQWLGVPPKEVLGGEYKAVEVFQS